ncbi:MAG: acetyl-CoA carboxylase biotin carboxyl carrier protein [Actinomycetota bacterium]
MSKITINDITLRDIFQNTDPQAIDTAVLDTILEHYSTVGFDRIEVLGGSTFEKMLDNHFYKSPFQICSYIKRCLPNLSLQALIGARNLVGMEMYSHDIIDRFIEECMKSGIDIFRVYDALNDTADMEHTVKKITGIGAGLQGTIIYDHNMDESFYISKAKELQDLGCTEICIKDVESTLVPSSSARLFEELTAHIKLPIYLSAYNIKGLQTLNYFQACVHGCGGIDLSFVPSSYNDYNPTIFTFINSVKGTNLTHSLNYQEALKLFEDIKKYIYPSLNQDLFSNSFILKLENQSLLPKWLINATNRQLKEIGEIEKMDQVIDEIIKIKKELGNPSLATPIGQIIASQAILNTIISDQRWEITSDEIKKFATGYFGKPPGNIDQQIKSLIFKHSQAAAEQKHEATDTYMQCKNELADITDRQEHILSYCFFPEKTLNFLKGKKEKKPEAKKTEALSQNLEKLNIKKIREITDLVETSNIEKINFEVDGIKISINKSTSQQGPAGPAEKKEKEKPAGREEVKSPIVGTFYRSSSPEAPPFVKEGDKVKKGDTLCIIEAMKLMNKITSDLDGEIEKILVANEEPVEFGQTLMLIRKEEKDV